MNNQLAVIVKDSGLEPTKAQFILEKFQNYFEVAAEWETKAKAIVVTDASQKADMDMARVGRLFLREKRIDIERTRKKLKEDALREGKAIDGISNVLKALIDPIEEYLESQEKFVEFQAAQKAEEERLAAEKKAAEELIAKEKAEAEAREKMRIENERLKKEAEIREKQMQAEREAALKKQHEVEEKARAEREKLEKEAEAKEKKAQAEKLKFQKQAEANLQKEREAKEKLEAELQAKKEAEAEELRLKEEAEEKAKSASDKEKILKFLEDIGAIRLPEVKSKKYQIIVNSIKGYIVKLMVEVKARIEK
jgi:hypothetical protein